MKDLVPICDIPVPDPRPDEVYARGGASFVGLKHLLGAADHAKSGDRRAGLAASNDAEREEARSILADLTLGHLHDHPLTDASGRVDAVMRVNYDIDRRAFSSIAGMTIGALKDHLLAAPPEVVAGIGRALTGVMAAAVAKLCDTHELIYLARKISRPTRARTILGAPGALSSRLQPNHPTDDLRGVTLLTYWGLSIGAGDALLGVNPSVDSVENVSRILHRLDEIRRRNEVPTQICVLGHLRTQLACLSRGAPVEILFQSIAGTEETNLTEFDITLELLDQAYRTMADRGPLRDLADQFMYFETGQGSELSYGKHNGIDMTTLEALCYGLCRRYDPFMVNNVTGFIGPETHEDDIEMIVSNLQDHFMGKLLGLPMGMAPCYTLHSRISLEGQQMATGLLTAAGANYYMDVCLNTDRMLAYFDTSGHDVQALREIHGKTPGAEYLAWAIDRGIFARAEGGAIVRGPRFGDVRRFCASDEEMRDLVAATPAVHGFEIAGPRPASAVGRRVRMHQAIARGAVQRELSLDAIAPIGPFRVIATRARTKAEHLGAPDLGAQLAEESARALTPEPRRVQIVISDGLSAEAVHRNIADLFPVLADGLAAGGASVGTPLVARHGRVKLAEEIADRLSADLVIILLGERPGGDARASRSLSAYLVYRLPEGAARDRAAAFSNNPAIRFEHTVIANIYPEGLPPLEAGAVIAERAIAILAAEAAGNRLLGLLNRGAAS